LRQLFDDLPLHTRRREEAREAIATLYQNLRQADPSLPSPQKGVITAVHLGRILGETGPLADFTGRRQLLRFAGLNLRERQSGTWRGKTHLSKKGRSLLRKILGQVVLPLVKRSGLPKHELLARLTTVLAEADAVLVSRTGNNFSGAQAAETPGSVGGGAAPPVWRASVISERRVIEAG
jgi:transposase